MANSGDGHLLNVPLSSRKHQRSRSWDGALNSPNSRRAVFKMPLTQRLMSVSAGTRANSNQSPKRGVDCVHCELQSLWNEKERINRLRTDNASNFLSPTASQPEIIVSSLDADFSFSSSCSSSADEDFGGSYEELRVAMLNERRDLNRNRIASGRSKSKLLEMARSAFSRSPTPPSRDYSPPYSVLLTPTSSSRTSSSRGASLSDTDSADAAPPVIPRISVTEFIDHNQSSKFPHFHSDDEDRATPRFTMTPSDADTMTPCPTSDVEDGPAAVTTRSRTPQFLSDRHSSSSDYLDAESAHLRSSSVDIPSLRHCIEKKADVRANELRTFRSRSVDLASVIERCLAPRSPVAAARVFTTFIRKAITRSPLPLARANAQLDLFANLNKERASRYWSETATSGEHLWIATGASTECYIGEMDCSKSGEKVKCSACHVIVHEGCLPLLKRMNFNCKLAYREAQGGKFQKEQPFVVHHHWVHKWRQEGRCKACAKSFQSKFLNKELVSISCSWCKTAYHNKHGCFTMKQIEEPCSMGPLRDVIVPPSWVFKLPPRRISTVRKRHVGNNFSSKRKRRSKKASSDRLFVVKPQPPLDSFPHFPTLIFVNPRSGGNKGAKILHTLQWLVNPRQVFDVVALGGPRYGLEMYRKLLPRLRVLVCGGDGTVGWVLSTLDALKWPVYPPIAVVPLGTGNDLSRTLGWGANYADEPMSELLMAMVEETVVSQLDRWSIEVTPNTDAEWDVDCDDGTVQQLPLSVMNNYFSIGADAHVALQFHESRSANPDVFNSRLKNRLFYGGIGTMDLFKRTWKDLSEHISLYCDGVDMTWRIQELKLHCLLFLNIPRYAGGTLPWGTSAGGAASAGATASVVNPTSGQQTTTNLTSPGSPTQSPQFSPPSNSDGKVEVLGFTSATLAALQVGGRGERITQCSEVKIVTRKVIPAQVDGEPCRLAPSTITMRFHSKVPMLQRISCKASSRRSSYQVASMNSSDQGSVSCSPALHTSVLLRLPVAALGKDDYDANKQNAVQLRAAAEYIGDITIESETDLDQVRGIVQRLLNDRRDLFSNHNISDWSFLDCISNDSVFRLNQSQEAFQSVSDICQIDDSLLIMHTGLQKRILPLINGEHISDKADHSLLDGRILQKMPEAMRIMFSSDEIETKI